MLAGSPVMNIYQSLNQPEYIFLIIRTRGDIIVHPFAPC